VKVLLTRSAEDNARGAARLAAEGLEPVVLACIRCETLPEAAAALEKELPRCGWLAFTSRRAVEAYSDLAGSALPAGVRVACVGETTASRARLLFGRVDLVSSDGTGRTLGAELAPLAAGSRVLFPCAEAPRDEPAEALRAAGVEHARVPVYRTAAAPPSEPRLALAVDAVFLASPSAVRGLVNQAVLPEDARVVCIGPTTRAAAEAAGLRVDAEASARDLDGMIGALRALTAGSEPER
jgi:uroporphyrinogen-III synthase